MKKIILTTSILSTILFADISDFAIKAYNNNNYTKAFEYFTEAANNDIMAQYRLGIMYEKGQGTKIDIRKSLHWHLKAAKNGHAISQFILANKYHDGIYFLKDTKLALYWYEKSAKQGYSPAQYKLATLYIQGSGVLKNYKEAKYWIEKAYHGGNLHAKAAWEKHKLWQY